MIRLGMVGMSLTPQPLWFFLHSSSQDDTAAKASSLPEFEMMSGHEGGDFHSGLCTLAFGADGTNRQP